MNFFLDTEFTGLHRNTTLISMAIVAETGEDFYCELVDYDKSQVNPWLQDNVITYLDGDLKNASRFNFHNDRNIHFSGTHGELAENLVKWFSRFDKVHIWADCLAYDWVLFCELFGGAMQIPKNIFYIPFDLSTLFLVKGIDPNISREEFSGLSGMGKKEHIHNALYDAKLIKACYEKLIKL